MINVPLGLWWDTGNRVGLLNVKQARVSSKLLDQSAALLYRPP